jgi:hypothetical protein
MRGWMVCGLVLERRHARRPVGVVAARAAHADFVFAAGRRLPATHAARARDRVAQRFPQRTMIAGGEHAATGIHELGQRTQLVVREAVRWIPGAAAAAVGSADAEQEHGVVHAGAEMRGIVELERGNALRDAALARHQLAAGGRTDMRQRDLEARMAAGHGEQRAYEGGQAEIAFGEVEATVGDQQQLHRAGAQERPVDLGVEAPVVAEAFAQFQMAQVFYRQGCIDDGHGAVLGVVAEDPSCTRNNAALHARRTRARGQCPVFTKNQGFPTIVSVVMPMFTGIAEGPRQRAA